MRGKELSSQAKQFTLHSLNENVKKNKCDNTIMKVKQISWKHSSELQYRKPHISIGTINISTGNGNSTGNRNISTGNMIY